MFFHSVRIPWVLFCQYNNPGDRGFAALWRDNHKSHSFGFATLQFFKELGLATLRLLKEAGFVTLWYLKELGLVTL